MRRRDGRAPLRGRSHAKSRDHTAPPFIFFWHRGYTVKCSSCAKFFSVYTRTRISVADALPVHSVVFAVGRALASENSSWLRALVGRRRRLYHSNRQYSKYPSPYLAVKTYLHCFLLCQTMIWTIVHLEFSIAADRCRLIELSLGSFREFFW